MAKLDKIFEVLENWQKRGNNKEPYDYGKDRSNYDIGYGSSTLNGGRPLSQPSLQDLSNAELEELSRAWDGNVGDVDFSQRNIPVAPPQPRLDGSPISQYDLDRIQLEGRPQPGRDLESFNDVEMPDYNFRGYRNR
tara:strand:- start:11 stop:418 length:408 start_codon:yes stop_codon:yes gene_type:complete